MSARGSNRAAVVGPSTSPLDAAMNPRRVALAVALSLALLSASSANVCKVPGTALQWVTALCLLESDTHDSNLPAVRECIKAKASAAEQPCELNSGLKTEYCEALIHKRRYKGSRDACVVDPTVSQLVLSHGGL